ncbi:hypothetical protein HPP92_019151 [Vanilla planifolia]|uniref:Uncharacterized protein n=1 Tax=Vanilla planifolia TaxID=51239 RepID=A0A835Q900_VANPL|nr:hypothetical protein HPP92_019151 [Vanilla planifolia]
MAYAELAEYSTSYRRSAIPGCRWMVGGCRGGRGEADPIALFSTLRGQRNLGKPRFGEVCCLYELMWAGAVGADYRGDGVSKDYILIQGSMKVIWTKPVVIMGALYNTSHRHLAIIKNEESSTEPAVRAKVAMSAAVSL